MTAGAGDVRRAGDPCRSRHCRFYGGESPGEREITHRTRGERRARSKRSGRHQVARNNLQQQQQRGNKEGKREVERERGKQGHSGR